MRGAPAQRLVALRRWLRGRRVQALLVSDPANVSYLSGFVGTAGVLLVTQNDALLITDFRYTRQARQQAPGWTIVEGRRGILHQTTESVRERRLRSLAFEADHLTYGSFARLSNPLRGVRLEPLADAVERLRLVKDADELRLIAASARITDRAYRAAVEMLRPGVREREVARRIEDVIGSHPHCEPSFPVIVASGPQGALPHASPGERKIAVGDLVVMDLGTSYRGYCSDLTRTVAVGEADEKQRRLYGVVLAAQMAGLAAVRPGVTGTAVDAASRGVIAAAGLGSLFGHGLGHGVGRQIHEGPRLAEGQKNKLSPGMVVTIEPGVYLPGWGGIRIEDLVVVTDTGCRRLSHAPKPKRLPVIG
jgi:Xaa-Pro aminopeptidase